MIIHEFVDMHGLRAAKMLRKFARVSRQFAWHANYHPDNSLIAYWWPPGYWDETWRAWCAVDELSDRMARL
jgi:hypothetical protein